jgi:DNA polymerase-1
MRAFHVTPRPLEGESESEALARRLEATAPLVRGMLLRLVALVEPTHLVVTVDTPEPTWRHALCPLYKAPKPGRSGPTSVQVLAALREWWDAWRVCVARADGWAADDLLAALVSRCDEAGTEVTVVSGDRDLLQLSGVARVLFPQPGKAPAEATPEWVREYLGVWPAQIACWKGLAGDLADGIPRLEAPKKTASGTRMYGFTETRAAELVSAHDDLEGVFAALPSLPKADEREWLSAGRERAFLSRQLARLDGWRASGLRSARGQPEAPELLMEGGR